MRIRSVTIQHIELESDEVEKLALFIRNVLQSNFGSHRMVDTDDVASRLLTLLEKHGHIEPPF